MKNSIALKMLKSSLWMVMVFGAVTCSKDSDSLDTNSQLPKEGIATQNAFKSEPGKQTPSPITPWATPGAITIWDNNVGVLNTALWAPPGFGPAFPDYSFAQFPLYDFSPYYVNGETEYNPDNYDVMAHFGYISQGVNTGAVIEFTFPNIEYFLPHMTATNQQRIYTVNYVDNKTIVTCTTNLIDGMNPMFCFLLKIDCSKGNSNATFWTDMKVNGVSVKGAIKNKVFDCNKVTTAHAGSYDTTFPLWCGDNIVDYISGTLNYHCVMQYENNVLLFMNMTYNGFLTGETGEVFRYKEITTFDLSKGDENSNFHFNAIGDRGSHFIVSGKYLYDAPYIIIDKAICSE